jgi:hypothetical protein
MSRKLTPKQLEANRLRAKKSTGPRTPEGKARSARNALKHGMFAETLLFQHENERLLEEITRQFYEDFAPANIHERMLIEQMIMAQWRLLRLARSRMPDVADWDSDLNRALGQEKIYASIYRSYAKAAALLERSRAQRGALPPVVEREQVPPIPVDAYDDPLSSANAGCNSHTPEDIRDPGFVPSKSHSEPPKKREKLPYEYDQSEFAPYERRP